MGGFESVAITEVMKFEQESKITVNGYTVTTLYTLENLQTPEKLTRMNFSTDWCLCTDDQIMSDNHIKMVDTSQLKNKFIMTVNKLVREKE